MRRLIAVLGASAVALMLSTGARAAEEGGVTAAQIEAAKTPADHEAIAKAYEEDAARLDAMAKQHDQMERAYRAMRGGKGSEAAAMAAHCTKLAAEFKAAAQQDRDLAAAHRQMAKDCCQPH